MHDHVLGTVTVFRASLALQQGRRADDEMLLTWTSSVPFSRRRSDVTTTSSVFSIPRHAVRHGRVVWRVHYSLSSGQHLGRSDAIAWDALATGMLSFWRR